MAEPPRVGKIILSPDARNLPEFLMRWTIFAGVALLATSAAQAEEKPSWKAGLARANITPEKPMWLAGYGGRGMGGARRANSRAGADRGVALPRHDPWVRPL